MIIYWTLDKIRLQTGFQDSLSILTIELSVPILPPTVSYEIAIISCLLYT